MPKSPRKGPRDPMAREVDRLLAQLTSADHPAERDASPRERAPMSHLGPRPKPAATSAPGEPARGDLIALWVRVLLGVGLGGFMTQWPYAHGCGAPLLGYLCAVATVILTGGWIGFASWRLRSGAAHMVSLVLLFWGIVLAAEQVLPRIGYAADQASWRCPAELPPRVR